MDLGPFIQLAAIRGGRAAVEEALSRPVAPGVPASDSQATGRLDGIVAGHLGDQLKARRAIRMGLVRVAGVVVFDPSAQVNPLAVVVGDG